MKKFICLFGICLSLILMSCASVDTEDNSLNDTQDASNTYEITENSNSKDTMIFEEQVIMVENDIRVIATSLDLNEKNGPVIHTVVENNSSNEIVVITENDVINYQRTDYFTGVSVPSGQSAKSEIEIYKYQLDQSDMIGTTCLEFDIMACNSESFDEIYASEHVKLVLELGKSVNGMKKHFTEIDFREQIIYEDDYVKVVAEGINVNGDFGPEIDVKIENLSNKLLCLETTHGSVNGYMVDFSLHSMAISPGDTVYDTIHISRNVLNQCGIIDIHCIELGLYIYTMEYEPINIYTPLITIYTNLENAVDKEVLFDSNIPLYENDGIKIIPFGVCEDATYIGPSLLFYIENESNEDIWIYGTDVAINGTASSATSRTYILSGKKAVVDLTFLESELPTKNAVLDLTILDGDSPLNSTINVEFRFQIEKNNEDFYKTEVYKISF